MAQDIVVVNMANRWLSFCDSRVVASRQAGGGIGPVAIRIKGKRKFLSIPIISSRRGVSTFSAFLKPFFLPSGVEYILTGR